MFTPASFARPLATIAGLGLLAACAVTPAFAAPGQSKPVTVKVPATSLPEETSRLCMPRTILGKGATKDMPSVMCHTRTEWAEKGVTVQIK